MSRLAWYLQAQGPMLNTNHPCESLGMVVYTCNSSLESQMGLTEFFFFFFFLKIGGEYYFLLLPFRIY